MASALGSTSHRCHYKHATSEAVRKPNEQYINLSLWISAVNQREKDSDHFGSVWIYQEESELLLRGVNAGIFTVINGKNELYVLFCLQSYNTSRELNSSASAHVATKLLTCPLIHQFVFYLLYLLLYKYMQEIYLISFTELIRLLLNDK